MLSRESPTLTINEIDRHKSPSGTLSSILLLNEDQTTSTPRVLSHHLDSGQSTLRIDIPPQTSQSHIITPQPGPTPPNQITNSTLSNSTEPPPLSQHQPASRPHSIPELAEIARQSLGNDPRPVKTWLRTAENVRRDAKTFQEQGNLELAFVEYAKAGIIVLEKLPFHPEYRVLLNATQRHNMALVSYICPMIPITSVRSVIHAPYEWFDEWILRDGMKYHFGVLVILSRLPFGHFHLSADSCSLGDYLVGTSTWRLTNIQIHGHLLRVLFSDLRLILVSRTDQMNSTETIFLIVCASSRSPS